MAGGQAGSPGQLGQDVLRVLGAEQDECVGREHPVVTQGRGGVRLRHPGVCLGMQAVRIGSEVGFPPVVVRDAGEGGEGLGGPADDRLGQARAEVLLFGDEAASDQVAPAAEPEQLLACNAGVFAAEQPVQQEAGVGRLLLAGRGPHALATSGEEGVRYRTPGPVPGRLVVEEAGHGRGTVLWRPGGVTCGAVFEKGFVEEGELSGALGEHAAAECGLLARHALRLRAGPGVQQFGQRRVGVLSVLWAQAAVRDVSRDVEGDFCGIRENGGVLCVLLLPLACLLLAQEAGVLLVDSAPRVGHGAVEGVELAEQSGDERGASQIRQLLVAGEFGNEAFGEFGGVGCA